MTTKTFNIQVLKTTISTRAGAHIVSDKVASRSIDLQGFGIHGYELISTVKVEGEGFVTLIDTLQRAVDE